MNKVFIEDSRYVSYLGDYSGLKEVKLYDLEAMNNTDREVFFFNREMRLLNDQDTVRLSYIDGRFVENRFNDDCRICVSSNFDLSNTKVFEDYYLNDLKFYRLLSVVQLPSAISELSSLHDFADSIVSYRKLEQVKAKEKLKFKRRLHFSSLFKNIKDVESSNAYNESEEVLEDIVNGSDALFEVEVFYILSANTKEELDKLTQSKLEQFMLLEGELRVESRGLEYFLFNSQLGIRPTFKRKHLTTCTFLNYFLPHHRDFVNSNGLKLSSQKRKAVNIDIFDQSATNYNLLISGASGQGKSMLANKIIRDEVVAGKKAMIVDLGNSFEKTTKYLRGDNRSAYINPLKFRSPEYLKAFVLSATEEKLSRSEQGRLFTCISSALEKGFSEWDDFISYVDKEFEGIKYNFSEIQSYFISESTPESELIYCDFTTYPESMKAPMLVYLLESFKRIEGEKLFVFDECWFLLDKCADFVMECFRTFRKHGASAIAISQSIDDFAGTELGRVIIQNSFHKFVFRQQIHDETFFESWQKKRLSTINSKKGIFSEFFYINDEVCKPIRFYPNCLELELFSSDKSSRNDFNSYMNERGRFLDFKIAMNNFVSIKYPSFIEGGINA